jgi:hypothetical protein
VEFVDGPVVGRGEFDQRLVRLDLGDRLVFRHRIAHLDQPLDEFALRDPLAHVRQPELADHARTPPPP